MDIIFFHANCPDGWAAAYIAKRKYPEAKLRPAEYGTPAPYNEVRGKDVIMVDFSWKTREVNEELNRIAKSFHIYDHHKTALADLGGLPFVTFDMRRSGAGIVWDELFGKEEDIPGVLTILGILRPWWVDYIEDRDLWNNALPDTRELHAYLMSLPYTIEAWDKLSNDQDPPIEALEFGRGAVANIDRYVADAFKMRKLGTFHKMTVGVVNAPYMMCSELGNALAKESQIGLCYYERADDKISFSLRSIGDNDVSAVAKQYGGGGHRNAAGFELPIEEGRELVDHILGRDLARIRYITQQIQLAEKEFKAKSDLEAFRLPGGCIK